jgi:hypothetical protein
MKGHKRMTDEQKRAMWAKRAKFYVRPKQNFNHAMGIPLVAGKKYLAHVASNQPNFEEERKVFVTVQGKRGTWDEYMLDKHDYDMVSPRKINYYFVVETPTGDVEKTIVAELDGGIVDATKELRDMNLGGKLKKIMHETKGSVYVSPRITKSENDAVGAGEHLARLNGLETWRNASTWYRSNLSGYATDNDLIVPHSELAMHTKAAGKEIMAYKVRDDERWAEVVYKDKKGVGVVSGLPSEVLSISLINKLKKHGLGGFKKEE